MNEDYDLLAKAEIEKYTSTAISFSDTAFRQAKKFAAKAQQGIIDALNKSRQKVKDIYGKNPAFVIEHDIKHHETLKKHIEKL